MMRVSAIFGIGMIPVGYRDDPTLVTKQNFFYVKLSAIFDLLFFGDKSCHQTCHQRRYGLNHLPVRNTAIFYSPFSGFFGHQMIRR